jgi:uncharacterized membrane protein YfcA
VDLTTFAVVAACVAVAAFVQGTTGVGFALIVAPIVGLLAPALLPVCLLVLMLPLNVYVAWRERAALDRSGAGWITLGRLVGTFGGLWILAAMPASALNVLIGAATILAATATLVLPSFRAGRQAFIAAGLVTGITETATGIGGPPLALVYQHHAAAVLRSTIAFCFLVGELISLATLAVAGRTNATQFEAALLLVPPLVLGAMLSRHVHHRLDGRVLRAFVLVFAIVSGAVLLLR